MAKYKPPREMHWRNRPIDQEFLPDERLFHRFPPQCFQDGKDQVGMDYYEHRSWPAWHRHMTYVFLALHFLLRLRLLLKKNSAADTALGSQVVVSSTSPQITELGGNDGNR